MFNIKSLGVGIGLSAVAAMMLTNPANGLININGVGSSSNTSSVSYKYDYPSTCQIYDPDHFEWDEVFYNYTKKSINNGYQVFDLDGLSINSDRGIKDSNGDFFSDGIYVTDNYDNPGFYRYYIRCDDWEYDNFRIKSKYAWYESYEGNYVYEDDDKTYTLTYDYDNEIMIFAAYYDVAG